MNRVSFFYLYWSDMSIFFGRDGTNLLGEDSIHALWK